jgi:NADH dehydrogenase
MAWHVVIAGGGFGGFHAARSLARRLPPHSARITLISDVNFMLYTPLLPGAAAGTIEPRHVVVPLREELDARVDLRLGRVTGADPARNVLGVTTLRGDPVEVGYDHLVVALGSVSRTLPVPGLAEHGLGFKSLPDAIALRNRLLATLEIAETVDDPAVREAYLSYVVVGAGYAGVEGLAELQDFAADVIDRYPRCRVTGVRFTLVEALDRIMPEIPEDLAAFAVRELRARGIVIRTGTTLERIEEGVAHLSDGTSLPARTVVWTAGVTPNPVVAKLGLPLNDKGRIPTDPYLQVEGHGNVWALGDAAAVPDPAKRYGAPSPPTAQHAIRQGRLVGRNIAADLGTGTKRRFTYKTLGVFVDMGNREAVAQTLNLKWRGFPAWLLARTYHLALMPGWGRRAQLLTDWNVGLLFGRDTAELGSIGHPPGLHGPVGAQTSGGTPAPEAAGDGRDARGELVAADVREDARDVPIGERDGP